jgi:hypothetical protein
MPDGSPRLTQTWVDTDGDHVLINTVEGFIQKYTGVLGAADVEAFTMSLPWFSEEISRGSARNAWRT